MARARCRVLRCQTTLEKTSAEELPWHLKECSQWTPLCEALSDIHTFEVMFLGPPQMKLELASYWKLLVDGPLFLVRGGGARPGRGPPGHDAQSNHPELV